LGLEKKDGASVKILLSAEQIEKRVRELAKQISGDYRGRTCMAIGVLENGFMFMADLVRQLDVPVICQFLKPAMNEKVQGKNATTEIFYNQQIDVKAQHVLLVEGLVQSGITSDYLMHNMLSKGAASVKLAAFLDKSSARRVALRPDYFGFILDESFVTGYGLGSPVLGRNLPYVQVTSGNTRLAGSPEETIR
jgi:hypoxanthine phosphoribosyltransferase